VSSVPTLKTFISIQPIQQTQKCRPNKSATQGGPPFSYATAFSTIPLTPLPRLGMSAASLLYLIIFLSDDFNYKIQNIKTMKKTPSTSVFKNKPTKVKFDLSICFSIWRVIYIVLPQTNHTETRRL
jgi:hypothetical protein